ncbi:MAG: hypothetical protein Q9224_000797 [Gallowayella concinna]
MPFNIDPPQTFNMDLFGELHGSSFQENSQCFLVLTPTDPEYQATLNDPDSNNPDAFLFENDINPQPVSFAQSAVYQSPAFTQSTSMSSSATSYTVSPAELHSGSGSGMLPYLSTPATDLSESPAIFSGQYSNQTSPEISFMTPLNNGELDQSLDEYPSTENFFPDLELAVKHQVAVAQPSPKGNAAKPRKATSSSGSPPSPLAASPAGINKRKTKKSGPLGPIHVPPGDVKREKTKRNTLAARKSRAKRVEYIEGLETENERLRQENERLQRDRDHCNQRTVTWQQRALNHGWHEGIQD